jgi:predicted DNA-binding transcriptional regulator
MDDRVLGALILVISIVGIVIYFWLVFFTPWAMLTIQASAFLAVAAMLLILAWIGYTMATTPPPVPIEDLDIDTEEFDFDWEEEAEETEEKSEEDSE